ncbi:MAG: transcription elongation factor GreAB, partial [bacterium]
MNKEAIDLILEQNPQLRNKREVFEALKPGAYFWHHSWGVGCVQAEDEANHRIIIKFESQDEPRSMDPAFCVQKLVSIAEDHVLVEARKQ